MTVSRLALIATVAFVAMVACKTTTPSNNPVVNDPITFAIKDSAFFQYSDYTADSVTHQRDSTPGTIIRRHIVQTGLNMFGKTNVAMAIDSLFSDAMVLKLPLDTTYFCVEGNGKRISQYGFVSSLVKQYSGGLVTINPHWNMLVALDSPTWTTDHTDTTISLGLSAQVIETTTGMNMDTAAIVISGKSYLSGMGMHLGNATVALLSLNVKFVFNVMAIFDPTVVASVVTNATNVGTTVVPEHHRLLTSFHVN